MRNKEAGGESQWKKSDNDEKLEKHHRKPLCAEINIYFQLICVMFNEFYLNP